MEYGARSCRYARDETERKKLWAARKGAFGAIGRISPDSMIQDAGVPRSRLPQVLGAAYEIAARYQLRIANVFHAGDGNLHPLICFDSRFEDEVRRVKDAGRELMQVCVAAGGTITGEHGVGLDKRELLPLVFSDVDMNAMLSVRAGFAPLGLCNPGKIVPVLRGCGEAKAVAAEMQEHQELPMSSKIEQVRKRGLPPLVHERGQAALPDLFYSLAQIVGEAYVVSQDGTMIVSPASAEEISEIMKFATREGWTVMPAGGMTWIKTTADLIVSTRRLNRIIEHEPADLIAIAQAGVTLTDFNAKLAENGQWLPLDPPDDGRASLGGVVATGIGGPQQFGYGRPRASVIGMKVILADGSMIKAGGRVVKNVAGYDLCKLFTGSYGSLGIITELNFKLRPRPACEATVIARGNDLQKSARAIVEARLFPVAAEIVSDRLLVRFAGNEKGVAFQIEQARKLLKNAEVVMDDAELWKGITGKSRREEPAGPAKLLMQRIKTQLDPQNVFNHGLDGLKP
jgi:FAD/FMN-containing dehydrogenase